MIVARVQTMVQLSEELVGQLDEEAGRRGLSRSALIRRLLDRALAEERAAAAGRRIAEGYERLPPGTPDEWGAPDELTDRASRDLLHRLDHEERAAGHPPW